MKERTLLKQLQRKNEKALEEIMKKYGAYVTTISKEILYLIFDYPHKHYTFKYFEV